jgi:mono/diheme cytochrome c family protein
MKHANLLVPFCIFVLLFSCGKKKDTTNRTVNTSERNVAALQKTDLQQSIEAGQKIYQNLCVQCHLPNGKGVAGNFPPLAGSNWLTEKRTESIRAVKYGQQGEIVVNGKIYNGVMTPMGLSDAEVADVMNYIMNSWGNVQEEIVTEDEVSAVKK